MTTHSSNFTVPLVDLAEDHLATNEDTALPSLDDTIPQFHEAARALLATMSTERQQRAQRRGKSQAKYVTMPKDKLITDALDALTENAAGAFFGEAGKRRALFLLGESDSGKTRAMEYHIPKREEFKPYTLPNGEVVRPFVSFEAPRPITPKGFARKALIACGYPIVSNKLTEQELFELLKEVIRNNRILFLHVDEMQHVLKGTTTGEIQHVSDIIKSLLQIPGWPLHMILSGVPSLARFLSPEDGDPQLRNRSFVVELKQMTRKDTAFLLKLQTSIMQGEGVTVGDAASDSFIHRLLHACNGASGTIIQMMLAAADRAIAEHATSTIEAGTADSLVVGPAGPSPAVVNIKHYAAVYALNSGCRPSENIFTEADWEEIDPSKSLAKVLAKAPHENSSYSKPKGKSNG
jgi:AAA domain